MSLSNIKDQAVPVRFLGNIISRGRIPNGLLFWGPEGVGKQYAALEFAKALNCKEGNGDACEQCLSCRKISKGNHPDVKIIGPKNKTRVIKNDTIEFIAELATYRPYEATHRIIIIEEAECMHIQAQNYFLKTLEEPPSQTVFILVSANSRRLLPTIRSRCQQVRFGALRPETVRDFLVESRGLSPDIAEAIASVSQGQMSRAFDLVDSNRRDVTVDMLRRLEAKEDPVVLSEEFAKYLKSDAEAIKSKIKAESQDDSDNQDLTKEDIEEQKEAEEALIRALVRRATMDYLYLMETWYRDVLVSHSSHESGIILNRDLGAEIKSASPNGVTDKFSAIEKAWVYIDRNLNTDRVFRDLFCALSA